LSSPFHSSAPSFSSFPITSKPSNPQNRIQDTFVKKYCYYITPKQGRQCTYKRNIEARSHNHCCPGKSVLHILCVCVCVCMCVCVCVCVCVALVIQHAEHMRRIVL
jgi:hypothetical protein